MVDHSDWRVGAASAPVHHGEILQGVFTGREGSVRGLVTLPSTLHSTRATFTPAPGAEVTVSPGWKERRGARPNWPCGRWCRPAPERSADIWS